MGILEKIPVIGGHWKEDPVEEKVELPDISDYHKDIVAPSGIKEDRKVAKVGEQYVSVIFIREWQDFLPDGALDAIITGTPDIEVDISLHLKPFEKGQMIEELSQKIISKRAQLEDNSRSERREITKERQQELESLETIEEGLENAGAKLYDIGAYITVRGETKQDVLDKRNQIQDIIRGDPLFSKPSVIIDEQIDGLQSTAPIGVDKIGYRRKMLSGSVGSLYPFTSEKRMERDGVEAGLHKKTLTPIFFNRWGFENGYNQMTIGKIGSGKSFSTKLNLLRTWATRDDLKVFMIDPLEGFEEVYKFFDAERIVIGGNTKINPLQINETPMEVVKEKNLSPYRTHLTGVKEFFEAYFDLRGTPMGNEKAALEKALNATYREAGIGVDPRTHSNESPTIMDLIHTLEDMSENPKDYVGKYDPKGETADQKQEFSETDKLQIIENKLGKEKATQVEKKINEGEKNTIEELKDDEINKIISSEGKSTWRNNVADKYQKYATELLGMLEGFRKGNQYHNFAQKTEDTLDISDKDAVWIDLSPIEGGGTQKEVGWMMKLLLDQLYSKAKQTDDKTMMAIDEAHYMLKNDTAIDYLQNIVRHSRHFDIALNFVTQEVNEFYENEGGEVIIKNCAVKWIHFNEGGYPERIREGLGLNEQHHEFIRSAKTGKEGAGYSEALVKIDNDPYIPLMVDSTETEQEIID